MGDKKKWVIQQNDRMLLLKYYLYAFLPMRLQMSKEIQRLKGYISEDNMPKDEFMIMRGYVVDNQWVPRLDHILRYETLTEDMSAVCKQLNIPWTGRFEVNGKEIHERGGTRKDRRHYREVYTPKQAREIGKIFKKFNEVFGYQY